MAVLVRAGLVEYRRALAWQEALVEARKSGRVDDTLLLLRHPDVITLGRPDSRRFLRTPTPPMPVVEAGRGGEVTYHGPGQLIAYPVLALKEEERDLHRYLRRLEEIGLGICRDFGLNARRVSGRTGVWVGGGKIMAIGVRARAWVTYHGIALNVQDTLEGFDLIVPCGITDAGVTSLEGELGRPFTFEDVEERFCARFVEVFDRELQEIPLHEFLTTLELGEG